jgi:hypothetical protein
LWGKLAGVKRITLRFIRGHSHSRVRQQGNIHLEGIAWKKVERQKGSAIAVCNCRAVCRAKETSTPKSLSNLKPLTLKRDMNVSYCVCIEAFR